MTITRNVLFPISQSKAIIRNVLHFQGPGFFHVSVNCVGPQGQWGVILSMPGCRFSCCTRPPVQSWPAWEGWGWGLGQPGGHPKGPPTPPAPRCSWRRSACGCEWWSLPPAGWAKSSRCAPSCSPCRTRTSGTHCGQERRKRERQREREDCI